MALTGLGRDGALVEPPHTPTTTTLLYHHHPLHTCYGVILHNPFFCPIPCVCYPGWVCFPACYYLLLPLPLPPPLPTASFLISSPPCLHCPAPHPYHTPCPLLPVLLVLPYTLTPMCPHCITMPTLPPTLPLPTQHIALPFLFMVVFSLCHGSLWVPSVTFFYHPVQFLRFLIYLPPTQHAGYSFLPTCRMFYCDGWFSFLSLPVPACQPCPM